MKLGVTMYSLNRSYRERETNIEDFINFCGTLGIQGVEFPGYYWSDKKAEIKKLPNLLRKNNLVLAAYGTGNNFVHEDELERKQQIKRVKREIDTAAEIGAPLLRIFGGSLRSLQEGTKSHDPSWGVWGGSLASGKTKEDAIDMVMECLEECTSYAEDKGIILALENHGGIPETSQEVRHMLDSVNSPFLRAMVDIGNFASSNQDSQEAIKELIFYTVHVHLKDMARKGSSEQSILGEGIIDLKVILKFLKQSGYEGFLSLEHEVADIDEKQGIRESINYAKKILHEINNE